VYSLTSYDLWKISRPGDDGESWEEYEDRYLAVAARIVVDALTEHLPRCLSASVYSATVAEVQRLVDGLRAETCLAWASEIAPDDVPRFEAWAHPQRRGLLRVGLGQEGAGDGGLPRGEGSEQLSGVVNRGATRESIATARPPEQLYQSPARGVAHDPHAVGRGVEIGGPTVAQVLQDGRGQGNGVGEIEHSSGPLWVRARDGLV
jgi:hypothetical protein